MIHRIHGKITFECDTCGENLDTESRDFEVARATMLESSWTCRKVGRDWIHTCDECSTN